MRLQLLFIVGILSSVHASSDEKRTVLKTTSSKTSLKFSSNEKANLKRSTSSPSLSTTRSACSSSSLPSLVGNASTEDLDCFHFNLDGEEIVLSEKSDPFETFLKSVGEQDEKFEVENFVFISDFEKRQKKFLAEHTNNQAAKIFLNEKFPENTILDCFVFGRKTWDGSSVDEANTRFQMTLFKLLIEPGLSEEVQLLLCANVVDFSFSVFYRESGKKETFLTLMCTRFAHKANLDKLRHLIRN